MVTYVNCNFVDIVYFISFVAFLKDGQFHTRGFSCVWAPVLPTKENILYETLRMYVDCFLLFLWVYRYVWVQSVKYISYVPVSPSYICSCVFFSFFFSKGFCYAC